MSLTPKEPTSLKLIKIIENGSAKTFIYENPNKKTHLIKKLLQKIKHKFKLNLIN